MDIYDFAFISSILRYDILAVSKIIKQLIYRLEDATLIAYSTGKSRLFLQCLYAALLQYPPCHLQSAQMCLRCETEHVAQHTEHLIVNLRSNA